MIRFEVEAAEFAAKERVSCPACGAIKGTRCSSKLGNEVRTHKQRVEALERRRARLLTTMYWLGWFFMVFAAVTPYFWHKPDAWLMLDEMLFATLGCCLVVAVIDIREKLEAQE